MRDSRRLVFVLGVAPRSGTNFVADLLDLHPEAELVREPPEDGLLRSAHHLDDFVKDVRSFYAQWPKMPTAAGNGLIGALGAGLSDWLLAKSEAATVVVKTPFPHNLALAREMFPDAAVVVVLRDGRDVAESTRRTWGTPIDVAIERWVDGVRSLQGPMAEPDVAARTMLIRYEDLLAERASAVADLLEHCGLTPESYDHAAAGDLGIRGSSVHGTSGTVSWEPVDAAGFRGSGRWENWRPSERELFQRMAADEMIWAGYSAEEPQRTPTGLVTDLTFRARRAGWRRLPAAVRDGSRARRSRKR